MVSTNLKKAGNLSYTVQYSVTPLQSTKVIPITIDDELVTEATEVKLLGITFDQHMKFSAHINSIITKSESAAWNH